MKKFTISMLAFAGILGMGLSQAWSGEQNGSCIQLWRDAGAFDSMRPDAAALHRDTQTQTVGLVGYVEVYVEHVDHKGRAQMIPFARPMYLFPTADGRYVARIADLPPDQNWYGPF